jgi:hypothetical protein
MMAGGTSSPIHSRTKEVAMRTFLAALVVLVMGVTPALAQSSAAPADTMKKDGGMMKKDGDTMMDTKGEKKSMGKPMKKGEMRDGMKGGKAMEKKDDAKMMEKEKK